MKKIVILVHMITISASLLEASSISLASIHAAAEEGYAFKEQYY